MVKYVKRGKKWFWISKKFAGFILNNTSNIHIRMPEDTLEFLKSNNKVIYVSIHQSLWETVALPWVVDKYRLKVPYAVMGNNLVKGVFVYPMKRLGVIIAYRERGDTKSLGYIPRFKMLINDTAKSAFEYITSQLGVVLPLNPRIKNGKDAADRLISDICDVLNDDNPVLIFPEGTRSKDGRIKKFKTTAFQAALISGATLVPLEIDYSRIAEEKKYLKNSSGKPYTFKFWHITEWFKDIGDVYINFGKPISAYGDRRILSEKVRQECMDLVHIMAKNVVSYASLMEGGRHENVKRVLHALNDQKDKFIDFNISDGIEEIIAKANLTHKDIKIYMPYAGHIAHYLDGKL